MSSDSFVARGNQDSGREGRGTRRAFIKGCLTPLSPIGFFNKSQETRGRRAAAEASSEQWYLFRW